MTKLQDWLDQQELTQKEFAARMGVSRERVSRVANGQPPSAGFILKFWRATDTNTVTAIFSEQVNA